MHLLPYGTTVKMPSTINCKFGDVVLVKFPFTNLQATKQRPAVIINSDTYYQQRPDVILLAITGQLHQPLVFGEYMIQEWQAAGLLKQSVFKPLIATIEQTQVIRRLGHLTASDQAGVQAVLRSILFYDKINSRR